MVIFQVVQTILSAYWYVLVARGLLSFFPDVWRTRLGQWLVKWTEPYLSLFRRFIPGLPLGTVYLDLSFLVALLVYMFVERGVLQLLIWLLQATGLVL
ncbi:MAG: YggT family protein [Alicyclobacillaceae bacterium]|nr:YggT family protein [Alicyclobacillaceae bacterium]